MAIDPSALSFASALVISTYSAAPVGSFVPSRFRKRPADCRLDLGPVRNALCYPRCGFGALNDAPCASNRMVVVLLRCRAGSSG